MERSVTFDESVKEGAPSRPVAAAASICCPNCGSTAIEQDTASGASVCTECGVVVEENAIVSSVEFVEGAGGSSSMVGQFVSASSSKAYTGGGGRGGGRYAFSHNSRETTLANGRRRIQEVASRMRLGAHFVDAAHRLFTIAVEKNFVQGRRTTIVVASCLYIACRQEKSQHMLIDFSDALQVNVYTLGTCFLKFRRLLGLKLEIIDPALYVYRFAAHLDLDEKANAVALTALRLVSRMKRDWIVAGRRPAGICAAALLIAARAHGFSRHHQDVTRILKVCGMTVTTRVREFEQTSSAALTLDQFHAVDLDQEADPPSFSRNRILEARARAIQDNNVTLLESGALDDPMKDEKRASKWREIKKLNEKQDKINQLYESIEQEISNEVNLAQSNKDSEAQSSKESEATTDATGGEQQPDSQQETENQSVQPSSTHSLVVKPREQTQLVVPGGLECAYPKGRLGRAMILPDQSTPEERQPSTAPVEGRLNLPEWVNDMPQSMSDEIESFFRTDEEMAEKEAIFNKVNKDYLLQQERKEKSESVELAAKDQQDDTAENNARYLKYSRKKRLHNGEQGDEPTTEEALLAAVANRKISRKINYDAMSSIFDDDGGFATDALEDGAAAAETEPEFAML